MRRTSTLAGLALAAVTLAGCGTYVGQTSSGSGNAAGSGNEKVTITSPRDGASVTAPVTLRWTSSVPLGPPDTGRDHVHVYVDGQANDYTVVGGTHFTVRNLSQGKHELDISLQHADHSPVGPMAAIHVNVTRGSTGGSGSGGGISGY